MGSSLAASSKMTWDAAHLSALLLAHLLAISLELPNFVAKILVALPLYAAIQFTMWVAMLQPSLAHMFLMRVQVSLRTPL